MQFFIPKKLHNPKNCRIFAGSNKNKNIMKKIFIIAVLLIGVGVECKENNIIRGDKTINECISSADSLIKTECEKVISHCTITTYNAVKGQCDDTPDETADGTKIDFKKLKDGTLRYVAVSRDIEWLFPMGSTIWIEGHGLFEVHDRMNSRWEHRIDILQDKDKGNFKEENIKIILVETILDKLKKKLS